MRPLPCLALVCLASLASAQNNWVDAGMPGRTVGSLRLAADPELGLISIGNITETDNFGAPIIPCYQNGAWNILRGFRGSVTDAIRYGDTLVVCGTLYAVIEEDGDSIPVTNIAAYYGDAWHPYGSFDSVGAIRRLKVLNGELYALGPFLQADGQLCNGVAKRVGGQWLPVGLLPLQFPFNAPNITDAIIYQGDLFVCGTIYLAPSNGFDGIVRFDGQNWAAPGGGLMGGGSGLAMAVYEEELYLGGSFSLGAGNAGHMIQKWNGTEWYSVGGHLRDGNNSTNGGARCYALFEHQGKLLAAGGFQFAGGVPAQTFAIWDSSVWCGTSDAISNESHSIALYNDTIYLASGRWVNGDSTNTVVKWVSGPVEGSVCTEVSVPESEAGNVFSLFPNPASTSVTLTSHTSSSTSFTVLDALGRAVEQGSARSNEQVSLSLEGWAPGMYHVRLSVGEKPAASSRFVKE